MQTDFRVSTLQILYCWQSKTVITVINIIIRAKGEFESMAILICLKVPISTRSGVTTRPHPPIP